MQGEIHQPYEVAVATVVAVHIFEGADLVGREGSNQIHVLVVFGARFRVSPGETIEAGIPLPDAPDTAAGSTARTPSLGARCRIRTQAQTAEMAREPSGVMTAFLVASATVSERSTWFTACSNSLELMRFSPLRKKPDKDESNFDTVALITNHNHKLVQSYI